MTDYGEFRFPTDAEGVRNALGDVEVPQLAHLLQIMADRDLALEHFIDGRNIPNHQVSFGAWASSTADFDIATWTVLMQDLTTPFPFATIQQPFVTVTCQPGDIATWDLTLQVRTAAAGGGTLLGQVDRRASGTNQRFTLVIVCDEWVVAPNVAQSYWVRAVYSGGPPTVGLEAEAGGRGERRARTRIRRDMSTF